MIGVKFHFSLFNNFLLSQKSLIHFCLQHTLKLVLTNFFGAKQTFCSCCFSFGESVFLFLLF